MSSRNAENHTALIHSVGENVVLLTPNETAARLRISESTLAKWRMTGDGPEFVKMGAKCAIRELTRAVHRAPHSPFDLADGGALSMAPPNPATPASAAAENGRRIEHAGEPLGQCNGKKSPFRHSENLPSKATLARRFPRLRVNRLT